MFYSERNYPSLRRSWAHWKKLHSCLTSWPPLSESLRTGFLPNLLIELALNTSSSLVLLIATVPSGHDSPELLHNWYLSIISSSLFPYPLGLSGGSCIDNRLTNLLHRQEAEHSVDISIENFLSSTNGFWPFSLGWSNADWRWEGTQSIRSPSGLCRRLERSQVIDSPQTENKKEEELGVGENAWIVFRGGLFSLLRWALTLLYFSSSLLGLKVLLAGREEERGNREAKRRRSQREMLMIREGMVELLEVILEGFEDVVVLLVVELSLSLCALKQWLSSC